MSTEQNRISGLRDHLRQLWYATGTLRPDPDELRAHAILRDPGAHINALVKAGVLRITGTTSGTPNAWALIPPHVHTWRVVDAVGGRPPERELRLHCCGCDDTEFVPNRVPIEVPE